MYRDIHTALKADFPIPTHHNQRPYTLSNIENIAGEYTRIQTDRRPGPFSSLALEVKDSSLVCKAGTVLRSQGICWSSVTLGHVHPHHDLRRAFLLGRLFSLVKGVNPSSNGGTTRWMSFTSALSETATTSSRDVQIECGFARECIFAP